MLSLSKITFRQIVTNHTFQRTEYYLISPNPTSLAGVVTTFFTDMYSWLHFEELTNTQTRITLGLLHMKRNKNQVWG